MHKLFLFLFLLPFYSFAQIKGTIRDSDTKEPIPYVNISFQGEENIELNTDESGNFTLPNVNASAKIVLSAVGYANTTLEIKEITNDILLTPRSIELNEVVIEQKKGKHSLVVNPVKKAKHTFMGAGGGVKGSLLHATYIPYKDEYAATPYIHKIRFKIGAGTNYTFNVRLQAVNEDGSPGEYLHNKNILVKVKKHQRYAEVDFSKTHLKIPGEGIFIVVEHIAIKDNRLDFHKPDEKFPAHLYGYGPTFLCEMSEEQRAWFYKEGLWKRHPKTEKGYSKFVVEVSLTD